MIDFRTKLTGTFKGDHLSCPEGNIVTGGGIPSPASVFLLYTKLSESGYQDVVAAFQAAFHNFQEGFDNFHGFFFGKTKLIHSGHDVVFGQRHSLLPLNCCGQLALFHDQGSEN
jgi:hypothetical protein